MATKSNIRPEIAEALKLLRVYHGMTQAELAEAFGVSQPYISQLESEYNSVTLKAVYHRYAIKRYSDYFNIPVSSIIFIAEHLESARQGQGSFRHCRAADLILQIELAKAELKKDEEQ